MGRIWSLDYLKLLMACAVALGHSGVLTNDLDMTRFVLGNGIIRNAVPVFSIVSGYFLHSVMSRGRGYVWLKHALFLYAFWFVIYLVWAEALAPDWLRPDISSPRRLVSLFVWGYLHLWYVIALFVAGTMVVAATWLGKCCGQGNRPLMVAALICAIAGCVMEYLTISGLYPVSTHHYRNGVFIIFPFVTIGYLTASHVATRGLQSLPSLRILWPGALIALCAMCLEVWLVGRNFGVSPSTFTEVPVTSYFCGLAIFLLFLRMDLPKPALNLGFLSAVIYFLHAMVEVSLTEIGITNDWLVFAGGVALPVIFGLMFKAAHKIRRERPRRAGSTNG